MAEFILGCLAIAAGLICAALSLLSAGANHMGGATNPSMVDHKPTVLFALVAVVAIGGGIFMLIN